jgi:hypothetical protein
MPSAASPCAAWNCFTPLLVYGPKTPSTATW